MAEMLELIVTFIASLIYGPKSEPKHPIWRNSVRVIAFGGTFVAIAAVLGLLGGVSIPLGLTILWAICALIVISGEFYLGSEKLGIAALLFAALYFGVLIFT
ncbi:MAG: hypothetical protein KC451_09370 [Amylibacter sp.]|jgi:hypothetical protein|nr:hypothetical protein [Amylibacter sp.]